MEALKSPQIILYSTNQGDGYSKQEWNTKSTQITEDGILVKNFLLNTTETKEFSSHLTIIQFQPLVI